jgi:hypothetical protein
LVVLLPLLVMVAEAIRAGAGPRRTAAEIRG